MIDLMEIYDETVSGGDNTTVLDDTVFDEILEILYGIRNYGSMVDYYLPEVGCYAFPDYEVYEYFIDIDAFGNEWVQTSDGHYVPLLYLDAYEGYRSGIGEEETSEGSADVPEEMYTVILDWMESISGEITEMKENNEAFYGGMQEYETELLETGQRTLAFSEGSLYVNIAMCVLLAVIAGTFVAHAFFGRMRAG